jgi:hypothetical protein
VAAASTTAAAVFAVAARTPPVRDATAARGGGDPEQRGDNSLSPTPHKLVGDRKPDRRPDERAMGQAQHRIAHSGMHPCSVSLRTPRQFRRRDRAAREHHTLASIRDDGSVSARGWDARGSFAAGVS